VKICVRGAKSSGILQVHLLYLCSLFFFVSCSSGDSRLNNEGSPSDTQAWPSSFGIGRLATQHEIDSINFDVRPDGQGLPPGAGNVSAGSIIYQEKCARCHGATGVEGPYNPLISRTPNTSGKDEKTIGNYWPYATTLYDYIHRSMPYDKPGSLTSTEVYNLTAFLLHENGVIDSSLTVTSDNLSKITMPAQKLFVDDDRTDGPAIR
jgi:cytochrome c